MGREGVTWPTF